MILICVFVIGCSDNQFSKQEEQLRHYLQYNFPNKTSPLITESGFLLIPNGGCKGCREKAWALYHSKAKHNLLVITSDEIKFNQNTFNIWKEPSSTKLSIDGLGFSAFYPLLIICNKRNEIKEIIPLNQSTEEIFIYKINELIL